MRSITTGAGLAILGACVLGAAAISSSKGNQAMAQTGSERRIVSASVIVSDYNEKWGYRIWSDNVIEMKCFNGTFQSNSSGEVIVLPVTEGSPFKNWTQVDNGLTSFVPADVDASQTVDASDLGNVLLNYGETQNGNPPPPIDCTINAPR